VATEGAERVRFGPEKTVLTVVVIAFLGSLPLALSSPWFTPLLLLHVLAAAWVIRARVVAAPIGLEVCNGLGVRRMRWQDVDRFEVPKHGPVVLHPTQGRPVRLTALPRRDLRKLISTGHPA
jgi:hypothetical protein